MSLTFKIKRSKNGKRCWSEERLPYYKALQKLEGLKAILTKRQAEFNDLDPKYDMVMEIGKVGFQITEIVFKMRQRFPRNN